MDRTVEVERLFNVGRAAMLRGDSAEGARMYEGAIRFLREIEGAPPSDGSMQAIRKNLANAYSDLAACILELCGPKVNQAVHALLEALKYGNMEPAVLQNAIYCISQVNAFMETATRVAPNCERREELVRWHNEGYDQLKTPYPPGPVGRNWDGAVGSFKEGTGIAPDCAASYHGLGLAYEGARREREAVSAWLKVKSLEPDYNFQRRFRLE